MDGAVDLGVFPGASFLVSLNGDVVHRSYHGHLSDVYSDEVTPDSIYDVSSLTKVIAATSAIMLLDGRDAFDVDWPVSRHVSEFKAAGKSDVRIWHLLSHRSGLPDYKPLFDSIVKGEYGTGLARDRIRRMAASEKLVSIPGAGHYYSDLGFIVLDEFFEAETGVTLDLFCSKEIYVPLGMSKTFFSRSVKTGFRFASVTNRLTGIVDDENCRAMGGVSGHAGLFSTVDDLHILARELLQGLKGRSKLFPAQIVKKYWTTPLSAVQGTHRLGWDTPAPVGSTAGKYFSKSSVGHLGFTGCSIWIDPAINLEVILLSNRVCPSRSNEKIKELRPRIHDAVFDSLSL